MREVPPTRFRNSTLSPAGTRLPASRKARLREEEGEVAEGVSGAMAAFLGDLGPCVAQSAIAFARLAVRTAGAGAGAAATGETLVTARGFST